jgi:two-component system, cell cycle sensor histidine kinase and response regulator CckA
MAFLKTWRQQKSREEQAEPTMPEISPQRKHTVLIIDDDPTIIEALHLALYEAGFEVLTSASGLKGINIVRYGSSPIDVVLLDYMMPGFDGGKTLPYIRQLAPNAKIVCTSGLEPKDLPVDLREHVDQVIHKPFTSESLIASLKTLLAEKPSPKCAQAS